MDILLVLIFAPALLGIAPAALGTAAAVATAPAAVIAAPVAVSVVAEHESAKAHATTSNGDDENK